MTPETRTRRRYDHRLRGLVYSTGNIGLALQNGVPRSTAKDWLRRPTPVVVTLDVTAMTEEALRQEVVALRQRNDRLIAVLRLFVVLLRISGFTLARCRVADGSKKVLLLRAIESSRCKPIAEIRALRVLKLSATRYHSWKREESCALEDVSSCPQDVSSSAHQRRGRGGQGHGHLRRVSSRADRNARPARPATRKGIRLIRDVVSTRPPS